MRYGEMNTKTIFSEKSVRRKLLSMKLNNKLKNYTFKNEMTINASSHILLETNLIDLRRVIISRSKYRRLFHGKRKLWLICINMLSVFSIMKF